MKRLFKKPTPTSREEIERQAAAELAAATGLGTTDPSLRVSRAEERPPSRT
ncbi:MAG: hypothetical protein M3396_10305 [Actinomycetota bacterium]|nr:hypothetical protein [Actinomycetota bacterium]MDQ3575092.1 hypothetical protein [Actinomycetota bacterium]